MSKAISNTSPLLFLYRAGVIDWLPQIFDEVWAPEAVRNELLAGQSKGYDVPGPAGLQVWGTLKVVLEAKSHGFISKIEPVVNQLSDSGMWVSAEVKQRILFLAGESKKS
jgi:predicted nucleic acid-binding protein